MLAAIHFYAQRRFDAGKVDNVSADRMLPPKFHAHLAKSKLAP